MKHRTLCLISFSFIICHLSFSHAVAQVLPVTDPQMQQSLNGTWQLKVVDGISEDTTVPAADDSWGTIPVPGCWEIYGFAEPSYDKALPLTGYYRTTFSVPQQWRDKRLFLRFDGVLYGYDLFVNGKAAGSWRSAYNTAYFDITPYVNRKAAEQQLAMRVITRFPGSDFDYNDDWAPCGIFRDVTLMAVPKTYLRDITIRTSNDGQVSVAADIANADKGTTVRHEILDAQRRVVSGQWTPANDMRPKIEGQTAKVKAPHLWTAETPYLYTLRTTLLNKRGVLQTFEHKFGFRELTIDGNVLKLNGRPIKLRGVTCHATDPRTGKVVSEALTLKDMKLMKEASINYIRTSHYPREPRFYELADSLGFYIVDEVPFGYGDKNLSDTAYYPMLQQRAQATVMRDKNHPSVIIWSVGNENPLTPICIRLGDWLHSELDASRPFCYPQVGSYFRRFWEKAPRGANANAAEAKSPFPSSAPIYAPHYPTTGQIAGFYQHMDRPVIFTEYCHTLGISLEDHDRQWAIIERTPGIAGGSVWEWVDQGMPFRSEKGEVLSEKGEVLSEKYGYEERVFTTAEGGFQMYGNKGTDGILYADRTPLPNYYELQRNYAQAFVSDSILFTTDATLRLNLVNRYDFLNLKDHVTFRWWYTEDRDTLSQGAFSPVCEARQTTTYALSLPRSPHAERICLLQLEVSDAQGRVFLRQSIPVNPIDPTTRLLSALTATDQPTAFIQEGPLVRAGRKATLAEMVKVADKRLQRYLLRRSADGKHAGPIATQIEVEAEGNAQHYHVALTPDSTDTFLSELGVAFLLTPAIDRVQWLGQGPLPTYPGRYRAGRYGCWGLRQGDLYFEGNRRGVDAAWLSDAEGNGLLLVCRQGNVNFEQTDRGIVVTYNVAVSGQGPKFARTAFPVIAKNVGCATGDFYLYRVDAERLPAVLRELFGEPDAIAPPFHPYVTQYDTYLNRFADIVE